MILNWLEISTLTHITRIIQQADLTHTLNGIPLNRNWHLLQIVSGQFFPKAIFHTLANKFTRNCCYTFGQAYSLFYMNRLVLCMPESTRNQALCKHMLDCSRDLALSPTATVEW